MLVNIAGLVLNTPLLVTPAYAETVMAVLSDRIGVDSSEMAISSGPAREGDVRMIGNTMVIPINGSISHRPMGIAAMSGVTSYASLQAQIERALDDPTVGNILLDISSPGGMVSGAFDFRDFLVEANKRKPIYAIARDVMASAAYLIGSAAERVYATQTAQVGSIGVLMVHTDRSAELKEKGIKPTIIHAGARKAEGNSFEPLSKEAKANIQSDIDHVYGMFVGAVAESRGMSEDVIRGTEAGVFSPDEALSLGLIDKVASIEDALEEISASAPRSTPAATMRNPAMNEAALRAEGATAERARISAILSHAEADGRGDLAAHLAFNTDMTPEAAAGILSASAKAAPAAPEPAPAAAPEGVGLQAQRDAAHAKIAEMQAGVAELGAAGAGLAPAANAAAVNDPQVDEREAAVAQARATMRAIQGRK